MKMNDAFFFFFLNHNSVIQPNGHHVYPILGEDTEETL